MLTTRLRIALLIVTEAWLIAGCGPALSDAARVWCRGNPGSVASAAMELDLTGLAAALMAGRQDVEAQWGDRYIRACNAAFEGR